MEGEEFLINPGTPTADVVWSYPGGGGDEGSRTTLEAHDNGVVLLVLGPGASSASTDGPATNPDLTSPTTQSNVPYTDWTTAHLPFQSVVVGPYAYPDVVMAVEHPGSATALATRNSVPSTGAVTAVIGESYTDVLMAHLSSDMYPATWNNDVAYPAGSVMPSPAINGVAMEAAAYPGGINLNAIGSGDTIGLGSQRLHPAGTAAAAAATEPGGGYYYNNSGMVAALPFAAPPVVDEADMEGLHADDAAVTQDDQVAGAVAEPVRGGLGLGGLGIAAISLAMAGLIAGGVDTPVTAIALYGMLIAGVVLVTVHVFRA